VFNAPGEYWRTKVVQLSNRYMLVNSTGRGLLYGQVGAAQEFPLRPGTQVPHHWADATAKVSECWGDKLSFCWCKNSEIVVCVF
jgi:hypothetical protein